MADSFKDMLLKNSPPGLEKLIETHELSPSNQTFKALTTALAPFIFTQQGMPDGLELLNTLPFNYEIDQWSQENFDQAYAFKWVPQTIPTLIISGEQDCITPLKLFIDVKEFHQGNIVMKLIRNAGHFPWIENPQETVAAFKEYYSKLVFHFSNSPARALL